jgi:hypothetical protein
MQEDIWVAAARREARRALRVRQWTWRFIFGLTGIGAVALVRLFITALRP